jgi:hypothetical protein
MALGDNYHEEIEAQGKRLHVGPLAVEPISDIAVLGNLDSQEFSTWCGEFEAYCEDISPLEICVAEPQLFQWFDVFIFTHKRTWVHGKARKNDEHAQALFIEADEQIEGGTSGGPIVNGDGSLVGIVSTFYDQETDGKCDGMSPRPHLTMPLWLLRTACASFQIGE